MHVRASEEKQRRALKSAFGVLVELAGGPSLAAMVTRVSQPSLTRSKDLNDDSYYPAIDAVLDLELHTGHRIITDILAHAHGYRLVPIEPTAEASDRLKAGGVQMVETSAAAFREIIDAISDGRISESERRRIEPLLITIKAQADAALDAIGGEA